MLLLLLLEGLVGMLLNCSKFAALFKKAWRLVILDNAVVVTFKLFLMILLPLLPNLSFLSFPCCVALLFNLAITAYAA